LLQHVGQFGVVEENHVMDSILDDKEEPKALTQETSEGVGWLACPHGMADRVWKL